MNLWSRLFGNKTTNKFNMAFFSWGSKFTNYDNDGKTYIEEGYNNNSHVFSVVNSISTKASSIPFYIKEIEDKTAKSKRDRLIKSTNYNFTPQQLLKKHKYETKAFKEDYKELPLEKPNNFQEWSDFVALYEVFWNTTGNIYIYALKPTTGVNKGKPIAYYLLPSHLMRIVLKDNINFIGLDNPVKEYMLIEGNQYVRFEADEIYHIKTPNPNYDIDGSHLYGQSFLRSGLKNIQTSNEMLNNNIKMAKNGGAYGFIHSKGNHALTADQAKGIKDRLKEMDADSSRLSKIAGVSAEIGFTRLSLSSDELKPFDYFKFDFKTICNILNWEDKSMNNDDGSKYDNYKIADKKNILNKILPDLKPLQNWFNTEFLAKYDEYKNCYFEFDVTELPEMQEDLEKLATWVTQLDDRGRITGNEVRQMFGLPESENPLQNEFTVVNDVLTLQQALEDLPEV